MPEPDRTLLVVTDLDGTLLDAETYALDAAREALDALHNAGIPLVIATSKTRPEVEQIAAEIGGASIFIVENGGAIVRSASRRSTAADLGGGDEKIVIRELGTPRHQLIAALADIAKETGIRIRGFAALSLGEIVALTELSEENARLASERAFDEPFLLDEPDCLPAIAEAALRRRLRVTRGGRLHHLTGETDKGRALDVLLREMAGGGRRPFTIGLGDAANDLSFLQIVDRPIVIPRPDGLLDTSLAEALPGAELAPHAGPMGWNVAVLAVLEGRTLPIVAVGRRP